MFTLFGFVAGFVDRAPGRALFVAMSPDEVRRAARMNEGYERGRCVRAALTD